MKKPLGRAPKEIGMVKLREIERGGKEHPWKVQLQWSEGGKRRYKDENNWPLAEEFARRINRERERRGALDDSTVTVGKAWDEWFKHATALNVAGQRRGNTIRNYRAARELILLSFERKRIADLTSLDIEAWQLDLINGRGPVRPPAKFGGRPKSPKQSPNSAKNIYWVLFELLQYARRRKWVATNVLLEDRVNIKGARQRRAEPPQDHEIERIIKFYAGPKPLGWNNVTWANAKLDFALGMGGGMRRGEACALHWKNIDLERLTMKVDKDEGSVSVADGLGPPKTRASARTIPLTQYVFDALIDAGHLLGWDGFVLKNSASADRWIDPGSASTWHRKAMAELDLMDPNTGWPKVRRHDLRHFYGSMSLALGHELAKVSKRMGHSDPSITTSLYIHAVTDAESNEPPGPIWHERFALAQPGAARVIEGTAIDISGQNGVALLTGPDDPNRIVVPPDAKPWVHEAASLLQSGWRIPEVARDVGKERSSLNWQFKQLGLPAPNDIRLAARNRRFEQLYNEGYGTAEMSTITGINRATIDAWRLLHERDMPQTTKALRNLQKSGEVGGRHATKKRGAQLNLL